MNGYLLILLMCVASMYARDCYYQHPTKKFRMEGKCWKKFRCQEPGDAWRRPKNRRGKKITFGCEGMKVRRWRCCIKAGTVKVPPALAPADTSPYKYIAYDQLKPSQKTLLDLHNDERACYGAQPLKWSHTLALEAQKHAFTCSWGHASHASRQKPVAQGENLAASSNALSAGLLANNWLDEQTDYDCKNNKCKAGAVCGHYTAMIWKDTKAVGCGLVRCNKGSPWAKFPQWSYLVCRYGDTVGNFVGQHPVGASKCGSCASSVLDGDALWAPEADEEQNEKPLEVCVPDEGAEGMLMEGGETEGEGEESGEGRKREEEAPKCICPQSSKALFDGPCIPDLPEECEVTSKVCADGETYYARPPECTIVCPEDAGSSSLTSSIAATVAAAAAGQALNL